jgi:hypothetical protein
MFSIGSILHLCLLRSCKYNRIWFIWKPHLSNSLLWTPVTLLHTILPDLSGAFMGDRCRWIRAHCIDKRMYVGSVSRSYTRNGIVCFLSWIENVPQSCMAEFCWWKILRYGSYYSSGTIFSVCHLVCYCQDGANISSWNELSAELMVFCTLKCVYLM